MPNNEHNHNLEEYGWTRRGYEDRYQAWEEGYELTLTLEPETGSWSMNEAGGYLTGNLSEWVPTPIQVAEAGAWGWDKLESLGWHTEGYRGEGFPLPVGKAQSTIEIGEMLRLLYMFVELVDPKTGLVSISSNYQNEYGKLEGLVEIDGFIDLMPAPEYAAILIRRQVRRQWRRQAR